MRNVIVFITVCVLVVLCLGIFVAGSFDTQYAPGYAESAFRKIKIGDDVNRVISLLGQPLSVIEAVPYTEWEYSDRPQHGFAEDGMSALRGSFTILRFDKDGRMIYLGGQLQNEASRITIGDGDNFLKLTNVDFQRLQCKTSQEVAVTIGSPHATYEYKAVKEMVYSRSPSSANYVMRRIGLDERGNVVHIWSKIYWD